MNATKSKKSETELTHVNQETLAKVLKLMQDFAGLPLSPGEVVSLREMSGLGRMRVRKACEVLEERGELRRSSDGEGWGVAV